MLQHPDRLPRSTTCVVAFVLAALLVARPAHAAPSYTLFESGQVRPLAISPDGTRLFAVNTPDNRLEIFTIAPGGLTHLESVPVGLEPVAVAARNDGEVWVVNHLSDSVSVVGVSGATARVLRTLLVGDEPRDIVFAGPGGNRAFITTAHRGQNTPLQATIDVVLTTPGVGRADVWVFDGTSLGISLGGDPLTIVTLFGDTPRALTVSPDGNTVYAAVFHSGNQTTALPEGVVSPHGGSPPFAYSVGGVLAPSAGLIVKFDGAAWLDESARDWTPYVKFSLPDEDVFAIDATAGPPVQVAGPGGVFTGVGTVLFNMATNPVSGRVYVANLEARNEVRFEGPGTYMTSLCNSNPGVCANVPRTVRGHLAESRITVLDGGAVLPRHLNKHVDYATCCAALPNTENANSLAFPLGMAVSSDGAKLYVAGFGSSEVGVYDTAAIEGDTFVPSAADQIVVSGGGPTGLVLDEANQRLYVLTRFDNAIAVVDTTSEVETAHVSLHNPEPASILDGRRFLYDASTSSSHGDSACASCHVFGDFDSLAWDLGNPDEVVLTNPGPFTVGPPLVPINPDFHPMKGPMTTQSLRGMANHGPMHWRGDRTGANDEDSVQPDSGVFDENAAFMKFLPAFQGLLGRNLPIAFGDMEKFTDFILQVTYPPNPVRNLDNSLTATQQAGRNFYFGPISDTLFNCNGCHRTDPAGNAAFGVAAPGFFGADGRLSFEQEPQFFKIAHLRNMYQKVGMFGMEAVSFFNAGNNGLMGDQVRGFGFLHDGSVDTLFRFHQAQGFNFRPGSFPTGNPGGFPTGPAGDVMRRQLEQFMLAFDTNLAPIVGQQITRTASDAAVVDPRIDLLLDRADAGECDVVVKGRVAGEPRGAFYTGGGVFVTDRVDDGTMTDAALRALANSVGQELTYTCVPPGSGVRIGIDRDRDGFGDSDEIDAGTDPLDRADVPTGTPALCATIVPTTFTRATIKDGKGKVSLVLKDAPIGVYENDAVSIVVHDSDATILLGYVPGPSIVQKGRTFKYVAYSGATGITRVILKESRQSPGLFKITLKTEYAWTPPLANETELTTEVRLNVGGRCFEGNATKVKL